MSDENTARHAECTVEFDGVDITSSIKPYLLSLTFTDNEEDASDDLQIKLQDREGVWMTDWLQKMLDGDVSAASSDGYKVGDVVQFLGGPHYKASTDKKANGTPKAGPAKITIIKQGALHPYHVIHTDGTSRVYGWVDASEISGKSGGSSSGSTAGTSWYGGHDYSNVYDYSYYRSQNADLRAAFGNDANAYLKHFVDYGMAEGRQGRASFNVYTYRDEHPELWEKFGDNLRGYYLWACGIPQ